MVKEGIHPNYGKAVVAILLKQVPQYRNCVSKFALNAIRSIPVNSVRRLLAVVLNSLINVTVKKAKQLNNSRQAVGRAAMLCSICL